MNNILEIEFNRDSFTFEFKSKTSKEFKGSITVTDLQTDCPYFVWDNIDFNLDFKGWVSPLSDRLMSVVKNNKEFPGFRFNVYGPNRRLLQVEKIVINKNFSAIRTPFVTPSHDMVGPSYVDFFYGDLCKGMDMSGVVIDAGANVGFFTAYAKSKGASRVYSIEPDPEPYCYLEKNFSHDDTVLCINKAMDWKCDVVSFDLILETSVASTITGLNKYVEGFNIWVETLNIANITSIEPEINLLKLDIEGAEYSVLKNLSSYYFKKINQIFLEFHGSPVELNSILKKEGYHTEYRESIETDTCGFIYAKRV